MTEAIIVDVLKDDAKRKSAVLGVSPMSNFCKKLVLKDKLRKWLPYRFAYAPKEVL